MSDTSTRASGLGLARTSHTPSAAAAERRAVTGRTRSSRLDIPSRMPASLCTACGPARTARSPAASCTSCFATAMRIVIALLVTATPRTSCENISRRGRRRGRAESRSVLRTWRITTYCRKAGTSPRSSSRGCSSTRCARAFGTRGNGASSINRCSKDWRQRESSARWFNRFQPPNAARTGLGDIHRDPVRVSARPTPRTAPTPCAA